MKLASNISRLGMLLTAVMMGVLLLALTHANPGGFAGTA